MIFVEKVFFDSNFTEDSSVPFWKLIAIGLTRCSLMMAYGDIGLGQHWLR